MIIFSVTMEFRICYQIILSEDYQALFCKVERRLFQIH
jgi:hypothetical protein